MPWIEEKSDDYNYIHRIILFSIDKLSSWRSFPVCLHYFFSASYFALLISSAIRSLSSIRPKESFQMQDDQRKWSQHSIRARQGRLRRLSSRKREREFSLWLYPCHICIGQYPTPFYWNKSTHWMAPVRFVLPTNQSGVDSMWQAFHGE